MRACRGIVVVQTKLLQAFLYLISFPFCQAAGNTFNFTRSSFDCLPPLGAEAVPRFLSQYQSQSQSQSWSQYLCLCLLYYCLSQSFFHFKFQSQHHRHSQLLLSLLLSPSLFLFLQFCGSVSAAASSSASSSSLVLCLGLPYYVVLSAFDYFLSALHAQLHNFCCSCSCCCLAIVPACCCCCCLFSYLPLGVTNDVPAKRTTTDCHLPLVVRPSPATFASPSVHSPFRLSVVRLFSLWPDVNNEIIWFFSCLPWKINALSILDFFFLLSRSAACAFSFYDYFLLASFFAFFIWWTVGFCFHLSSFSRCCCCWELLLLCSVVGFGVFVPQGCVWFWCLHKVIAPKPKVSVCYEGSNVVYRLAIAVSFARH